MESLIIEDNYKKWFEKISNSEEKVLISFNWKEIIKKINFILSSSQTDFELRVNVFIFLTKIIKMNFLISDSEIKSYFNDLFPIIISYASNSNKILSKYSINLIKNLIDFNENLEFITKFAIKISIDGKDWQEKYSGIIVIKLLCENKKDFFIKKPNFCEKIIETLILCYKNTSEIIQKESANILTKFLKNLPNYGEITKLLPAEIMNRIYHIQCQSNSELETKLDKIIHKSINLLSNPLNSIQNYNEDDNNNNNNNNDLNPFYFIDSAGFIYGIFPKDLILELNNSQIEFEQKIKIFQEIYEIFKNKGKNSEFLRFSSTFFKFLSKFLISNSNTITLLILNMMDEIISGISGINLITSFYSTLPIIFECFDTNNIEIRLLIRKILEKIIMIIPTSQMIPFIINSISKNHKKWLILQECLNFLDYIFTHLNEIYNDIEFYGQNANYDINIFLEILKLWDHPINKIIYCAKKVIKTFGEKVCKDEKEKFIKTLSYYTNDSLHNEIIILFNSVRISNFNFNKNKFDTATQRVLSALNPKFNIKMADEKNNLLIYSKIRKYENFKETNDKIKIEENLIKNLLDNNGNIIKFNRPAIDNYPNYEIDKDDSKLKYKKNKIEKKSFKTKLKRYNDPNEINLNEAIDKNYNYNIKERNDISPLHYDKKMMNLYNIYYNLLSQIENKLNWEKQFKALDNLRKIFIHHKNITKENIQYFNKIIKCLLDISCSNRSLLARNALKCLSEMFEINNSNIKDNYENILKVLIKKSLDKNATIKEEAIKSLISLIMFSNVEKLSDCFINNYKNIKNGEVICIIIMCYGFFLKYHKQKIFHLTNWSKMIIYVTEQYDINRKNKNIRDACLEFYEIVRNFIVDEERFQNYLKNYFSYESLNSLIFNLGMKNN